MRQIVISILWFRLMLATGLWPDAVQSDLPFLFSRSCPPGLVMFLISFFLLAAAPCGEFSAPLLSKFPIILLHVCDYVIYVTAIMMKGLLMC